MGVTVFGEQGVCARHHQIVVNLRLLQFLRVAAWSVTAERKLACLDLRCGPLRWLLRWRRVLLALPLCLGAGFRLCSRHGSILCLTLRLSLSLRSGLLLLPLSSLSFLCSLRLCLCEGFSLGLGESTRLLCCQLRGLCFGVGLGLPFCGAALFLLSGLFLCLCLCTGGGGSGFSGGKVSERLHHLRSLSTWLLSLTS